MVDLSKHIIFVKNSDFIVNQVLQQLYSKGLDKKSLFKYDKKKSIKEFREDVFTLPMFGTSSVGIIEFEGEYTNEYFDDWIDKVPNHAYILFLFDRIPGRVTQKVKNNVTFRDQLSQAENEEVLNTFLVILGKKVSTSARKVLLNKMNEDPSKVLTILEKLASYTPHLWIEESLITSSFDETLSAFEGPLAFWKSKGLESVRILDKLEYASFRALFPRFLMTLIRFKLAEGKPIGEKMKIIKASPDVIRLYEGLVKQHTLIKLQAYFLYYTSALLKDKQEFLIYHLTKKF